MKDDLEAIKDANPSGEAGSPWSGDNDDTSTAAQHSHTTESELTDHTDEGGAGPFWPGAYDTTSTTCTAVVKPGCEARPLELAQHSATTEPDLAEYSVASASNRTTSEAATAVAESAGEARPPGIIKHGATVESDFSLAGRLEHGVVKPSGKVISLPSHTASNPYTRKLFTGDASSTSGPGMSRLQCWVEH